MLTGGNSAFTIAVSSSINDGSIGSILLKNVKRVLAGDHSRELSVKVFAANAV